MKFGVAKKFDEKPSMSVVDEINRNKRIWKKCKFKNKDEEFVWKCFLETFKKTFKLNCEIEKGLKFNLKTNDILVNYEIEDFIPEKRTLEINWKINNDKYWLKFLIRKKYIFSGTILRCTQHIYKQTPFWGLQDTIGLNLLKRNFKKEIKNIGYSTKLVINNNGVVPNDLSEFNSIKKYTKKIKLKNINNIQEFIELLKKYYQIKSNFDAIDKFTSKNNKNSIVYYIENYNKQENFIKYYWNQCDDKYMLTIFVLNNKIKFNFEFSSFWGPGSNRKYRIMKYNQNQMIKQIRKINNKN